MKISGEDAREISDTDLHIGLQDAARLVIAYPHAHTFAEIQTREEDERRAYVRRREELYRSKDLEGQAKFGASNSQKELERERHLDEALKRILSAAADATTEMELSASDQKGGLRRMLSALETAGLRADFSGRDRLVDQDDRTVWYDVRVNRLHLTRLICPAPDNPGDLHIQPLRIASRLRVQQACKAIYAQCGREGIKPPNINELARLVRELLSLHGEVAKIDFIKSVGQEAQFKQARGGVGVPSKKRPLSDLAIDKAMLI